MSRRLEVRRRKRSAAVAPAAVVRAAMAVACAICALALAPVPGAAQEWDVYVERGQLDLPRGTMVIRDLDAVWTATGDVLRDVSIVVRDGMIREIGSDVSAPRGATEIDGSGLTAMPGIVDEHSHTAMDRSTNEGTVPISAEVRVVDALDPTDLDIFRALAGGVTTALVLHGSANPIGGQSAVIKMRWGMDRPEELLFEGAPKFIKFALGENVTRKNFRRPGRPSRFPESRAGVEALYEHAFTAALEYRDLWRDYERNRGDYPVPPRRDYRLETLVDVIEGRIRVHAHSYRSDEIVMLMRVAERFGFRIDVFTHVLEGYKVADELAAHGAGASTFSDWWAYKLEAYDAIPYNAAIMHEQGVLTSLNSDIPFLQQFMVYEMNKPVKYGGLSKEEALRMVTLYPALQLRIEDRVGTLEPGKEADLVLLSGDPFDTYSRVEKTIVDGILYYDRAREAELRGEPVRELPDAAPARPVADRPTATNGNEGGASGSASASTSASASASVRPAGNAEGQGQTTALVGATVHPVAGPAISDGAVVIANGRIVAVGPRASVSVPAGADVIDLSGKHVYPGMIDPYTQLGMIEIGQVAASRDDREAGRYNPHLNALWGVHPHSVEIGVARANGITATQSVPASGVVHGTGAVIQLDGDTPERMAIVPEGALAINFPSPDGESWEEPKLEGERVEELIDLFDRAVSYSALPTTSQDPTRVLEGRVWGNQEVMLSAMVPAVTGERPVFFEVRGERDIRTLLMFLDEFPAVRAVIVGGDQAFRLADELAEREIPVIVGSALSTTMDREDPVTAAWRNAAILHAAGVTVAFTTGDYADVRNLPYHAAKSAAFGLPREIALRAVTLTPAELLGLGDRMGSIEAGKRADLIVTDGDPLQIVTAIERMWIGGSEVSLESKHTRLWQAFRDRE